MAGCCVVGRGQVLTTFSGHRPTERKNLKKREEEVQELKVLLRREMVYIFSPVAFHSLERQGIEAVFNNRFTPRFGHHQCDPTCANSEELLQVILSYPQGRSFLRVEEKYLKRLVYELSAEPNSAGAEIHFLAWRREVFVGVYTYYGVLGQLVQTWWNPRAGEPFPRSVGLTHLSTLP